MTASIARLTSLPGLDRAVPGRPAKANCSSVVVSICTLALLAAAPVDAQAQGTLITWGGERLDDPGTVSDTPSGTFIAVSAGIAHSHAIRTDGTLVSWGSDLFAILSPTEFVRTGQVGDTPAGTFIAVSAGIFHSVAIRTDGTLVSWGLDDHDSGVISDTPAGTFIAVAAGFRHTVAIRTDGTLVEWGEEVQSEFALRPTTGTYIAVGAGFGYSVALRTDGTLVTWGDHTKDVVLDTPAGTFSAVAGGYDHAVAIRTNGTLASWGRDGHGEVSDTPAGTYSAVGAGDQRSVAIRSDPFRIDGRLVEWGFVGPENTPPFSCTAVAVGSAHSVAIRRPLTVLEQFDVMSLTVQDLVECGVSLPANGQSLQAKLDDAAVALEVDDTDAAIGSMGAFINQTGAYVRTNKLTDAQGENLIILAENVIIDLGG